MRWKIEKYIRVLHLEQTIQVITVTDTAAAVIKFCFGDNTIGKNAHHIQTFIKFWFCM